VPVSFLFFKSTTTFPVSSDESWSARFDTELLLLDVSILLRTFPLGRDEAQMMMRVVFRAATATQKVLAISPKNGASFFTETKIFPLTFNN